MTNKPRGKNGKPERKFDRTDAERVAEIAEFGLMILTIAWLRFFRLKTVSAARSWLRRMGERDILQSKTLLTSNVKYWWPTSIGVAEVNRHGIHVPVSAGNPLGVQNRKEKYAFLLFCSPPNGPHFTRCRPCLMREDFPDVYEAFCLSKQPQDSLHWLRFYRDDIRDIVGLFILDKGSTDFVDSVVGPKVESLFDKYKSFRKRADIGKFEITVATNTERRLQELKAEFGRDQDACFPCQVVLITDINHFGDGAGWFSLV